MTGGRKEFGGKSTEKVTPTTVLKKKGIVRGRNARKKVRL